MPERIWCSTTRRGTGGWLCGRVRRAGVRGTTGRGRPRCGWRVVRCAAGWWSALRRGCWRAGRGWQVRRRCRRRGRWGCSMRAGTGRRCGGWWRGTGSGGCRCRRCIWPAGAGRRSGGRWRRRGCGWCRWWIRRSGRSGGIRCTRRGGGWGRSSGTGAVGRCGAVRGPGSTCIPMSPIPRCGGGGAGSARSGRGPVPRGWCWRVTGLPGAGVVVVGASGAGGPGW